MTDQEIKQQIEAIKNTTIEACKSPETARQFLIDAGIIDGIKSQPPQQSSPSSPAVEVSSKEGWVKVEDRLPEDNDFYTVASEHGTLIDAHQCREGNWYGYSSGNVIATDITHWQPLPSPPSK